MKKMIKSMVLAACMTIAAGAIAGTASAEEQWDGLNPCDMGANPCTPDAQNEPDATNPCDQGGGAENPCAPQADDPYMDNGSAEQEPGSGADAQ